CARKRACIRRFLCDASRCRFVSRSLRTLHGVAKIWAKCAAVLRGCGHAAMLAAARPDDVLDNDLLTETFAQNRRYEPPAGVEWPAGSVRYNHGHRPRWPVLRPR